MKSFYITSTLPYVNADPHIGFALEIIQADAIARYHRLLGEEVVFNTGTDEHGLKIYRKAAEEGKDTQAYCDEYAAKFHALKEALNLSYTNFIRTTDTNHKAAAQEFWRRCLANGDIYKKNYQVKYCVGCELEKTDSELVDNKCPIHPKLEIEMINEENYFFRWSKYQQALLDLYRDRPDFVVPPHRLTEVKAFVERGLEDFSISRLKAKMPWGVQVPDDNDHVMYVWFDALVNYISTLGWPKDQKNFELLWPGVQVAGKDNLRQQSAMWQGMLLSAGLPTSRQIFIHGFITSEGQKMSKSLGNVVNPLDIVQKYGTDAVRHYLLGALPPYEDGDFSIARFEEWYTAHLVNGVGNLTSRILTMLEKYSENKVPREASDCFDTKTFWQQYGEKLKAYRFDEMVNLVNDLVMKCDGKISEEKPWSKAKAGENIQPLLYQLVETLRHIAIALLPIIPSSAEKILVSLGVDAKNLGQLSEEQVWGKLKEGAIIKKGEILFPRLTD
jgi:methionyl-tRNA synthetase